MQLQSVLTPLGDQVPLLFSTCPVRLECAAKQEAEAKVTGALSQNAVTLLRIPRWEAHRESR